MGYESFDLLNSNKIIPEVIYYECLWWLKSGLGEKQTLLASRGKVLVHQDNARLHTVTKTFHNLEKFGWETICTHPSYSSDIAESNYHLLGSRQKELDGEKMYSLQKGGTRHGRVFFGIK